VCGRARARYRKLELQDVSQFKPVFASSNKAVQDKFFLTFDQFQIRIALLWLHFEVFFEGGLLPIENCCNEEDICVLGTTLSRANSALSK